MPTKLLEKPRRIQLVIFKQHILDALEKGKKEAGIDFSTTYLKHLIVKAVQDK